MNMEIIAIIAIIIYVVVGLSFEIYETIDHRRRFNGEITVADIVENIFAGALFGSLRLFAIVVDRIHSWANRTVVIPKKK